MRRVEAEADRRAAADERLRQRGELLEAPAQPAPSPGDVLEEDGDGGPLLERAQDRLGHPGQAARGVLAFGEGSRVEDEPLRAQARGQGELAPEEPRRMELPRLVPRTEERDVARVRDDAESPARRRGAEGGQLRPGGLFVAAIAQHLHRAEPVPLGGLEDGAVARPDGGVDAEDHEKNWSQDTSFALRAVYGNHHGSGASAGHSCTRTDCGSQNMRRPSSE